MPPLTPASFWTDTRELEKFLGQPVELIYWLWSLRHLKFVCNTLLFWTSWLMFQSIQGLFQGTIYNVPEDFLVLFKYCNFLLKRFPSLTRWALNRGSHNPSSDLTEGKVGQWPWPALFTSSKMTKTWVISPIWAEIEEKMSCHIHALWALHSWECQKSLHFWKL